MKHAAAGPDLVKIFHIFSSYTSLIQIETVALEATGEVCILYSHFEKAVKDHLLCTLPEWETSIIY